MIGWVYMFYCRRTEVMGSGLLCCFFFQAEDGIRDLVRSRGLGDVYKRQGQSGGKFRGMASFDHALSGAAERQGALRLQPELVLSLIHI